MIACRTINSVPQYASIVDDSGRILGWGEERRFAQRLDGADVAKVKSWYADNPRDWTLEFEEA